MAPTNPWGKQNTSASGFPGLKSNQFNNPPKSQYEEIQEDELIALASIYGDDFKRIETKQGAWKVFISLLCPNSKPVSLFHPSSGLTVE